MSKCDCALCVWLTIPFFLDIAIVDTRSDLNIYKDLVQEQMGLEKMSDKSERPGCCGVAQVNNAIEGDLLEHDFNEWAGESSRLFDCWTDTD